MPDRSQTNMSAEDGAVQKSGGGIPPWVNKTMRFILRSPLHSLVSKNVMLITFTGRKSGKTFTTPVSYVRDGGTVTLFTHAQWWKNLRGGAPVTLRIRGRDYAGVAEPVAEDSEVVAAGLGMFLRRVRRDAQFYDVETFDPDGRPDPDEVARGAQDTVMICVHLT